MAEGYEEAEELFDAGGLGGGADAGGGELAEIRQEHRGSTERRAAAKALVATSSEDLAVQYALARERTHRWSDLCRVLRFRLRLG